MFTPWSAAACGSNNRRPWNTGRGWLPIHAYAIEHGKGVVVIDAGADASLMRPGWHRYFRLAVEFDIDREQEIGPPLKALGIGASDVRPSSSLNCTSTTTTASSISPVLKSLACPESWRQRGAVRHARRLSRSRKDF